MSRVVLYDSMGKVVLSLELEAGAEKELSRLLSKLGSQLPLGGSEGFVEAKMAEGSGAELNRSPSAGAKGFGPLSASPVPLSRAAEAAHLAGADLGTSTEPSPILSKKSTVVPGLSASLAPPASSPGAGSGAGTGAGPGSGSGSGSKSGLGAESRVGEPSRSGSGSGSGTGSGAGSGSATAGLPDETPSNTSAEASRSFQKDEHLEHLDRARAFIFRGASHEIRGALNIQSLLLDLLQTRLQRLGVPKNELEPSCAKIAAQVPRIVQKMDWLANLNPDGKALNSSAEVTLEELLQSIWAFAQKMAQPRGVDVGLQVASGLAGPAPSSRLADALVLLFCALIESVQDVELTVSLQTASAEAPLLMHRSWPNQAAVSDGEDGARRKLSPSPGNRQEGSELWAKSSGESSVPGLSAPALNCVPPIFELQILGARFTRDSRLEVALRAFERMGSRWQLDDTGLVLWL